MFNKTLWKLSWKNILHNPVLNFMTLLQMIAVFFIAISLTSGICSRFDDYLPFRPLLSAEGEFYNTIYAVDPQTGITLNRKTLSEKLYGEPELAGTYNVWLEYTDGKKVHSGDVYISYDDALLKAYIPELESGTWFPETFDSQDKIPVVVSQNQYGLQVGDEISFAAFGYEENLQARVIGVMKEGAKFINCTNPKNDDFSAKNLYYHFYHEIEERTLFLFPQSLLDDGDKAITQLHGPLFVTYTGQNHEAKEKNREYLKTIPNSYCNETDVIQSNSYTYIFEECRLLFPILLAVLIMTVVGSMSVNALMAKHRLRAFAVFYICGLKWRECAKISLISSFMIGALSFAIAVGSIGILQNTTLLANSVIRIGWVQIVVLLGIMLIYMLFAIALPIRLIRSRTPIQVLHSN